MLPHFGRSDEVGRRFLALLVNLILSLLFPPKKEEKTVQRVRRGPIRLESMTYPRTVFAAASSESVQMGWPRQRTPKIILGERHLKRILREYVDLLSFVPDPSVLRRTRQSPAWSSRRRWGE